MLCEIGVFNQLSPREVNAYNNDVCFHDQPNRAVSPTFHSYGYSCDAGRTNALFCERYLDTIDILIPAWNPYRSDKNSTEEALTRLLIGRVDVFQIHHDFTTNTLWKRRHSPTVTLTSRAPASGSIASPTAPTRAPCTPRPSARWISPRTGTRPPRPRTPPCPARGRQRRSPAPSRRRP